MWEGYDDQGGGKPYLWIFFVLLLVVMSSIFILKPDISSLPGTETPGSRNVPLITELVAPGIGEALFLQDGNSGLWSVSRAGDEFAVSYLDAEGITAWQHISRWEDPVIRRSGSYLVMAEFGGSHIAVFFSGAGLAYERTVPGRIRDVVVSESGEAVVALTRPDEDPLYIRSYLVQVSATGADGWEVAVQGTEILRLEQAADGSLISVLALHLEGGSARTTLAAYSLYGARMFIKDFAAHPVDVAMRMDGGAIAVATGREIRSYDQQGQLMWTFDSGVALERLSYVGRSVNLVFEGQRKTLFTFGPQSMVGVVGESGKLLWQYRTRDEIVSLGLSAMTTNVLICTDKRIHLYSHDGNVRWTMPHDWGPGATVATVDGRSYFVHAGRAAFLLRGQ